MADPFIYYHDSKYYILYESLNYDTNKGYITIGILDSKSKSIVEKKPSLKKIITYHIHLYLKWTLNYI